MAAAQPSLPAPGRASYRRSSGAFEREIRACAVHACELLSRRLGVPPRVLDNKLWNRGQAPPYSERRAHLTRTVFY